MLPGSWAAMGIRPLRARDDLIDQHLPLADRLARRFRNRGQTQDDLQQVARLGLVQAADRYDPTFDAAFTTYATEVILGALREFFRDATWAVHVPRSVRRTNQQVRSATDHLRGDLKRDPTVDELARFLRLDRDEVARARDLRHVYRPSSLDHVNGDPVVESETAEDRIDQSDAVQRLLACLPPRESRILALRFLSGQTQQEIADELGLSERQVRRLIRSSIEALRPGTVERRAS